MRDLKDRARELREKPWLSLHDYQGDCATPDCAGERGDADGLCAACTYDDDGDR